MREVRYGDTGASAVQPLPPTPTANGSRYFLFLAQRTIACGEHAMNKTWTELLRKGKVTTPTGYWHMEKALNMITQRTGDSRATVIWD